METKSNKGWMGYVRDQCEFKHGLIVPSDGSSGDLALFWRKEVTVHIQNFSSSHINAFVDGWWHLIGFYVNLETSRRSESWSLLKSLSNYSQLPWLAISDFNELVGLFEKEGCASRPASQMERFKEVIDVCGLKGLGFIGPRFTWFYQKFDGTQIRERLDCALATCDWMGKFPIAKFYHLSSSISNHYPLALHFVRRQKKQRYHRPFKFESMWLKNEKCEEVVQKAWDVGLMRGSAFPLTTCLESCRDSLEEWNKNDFGHVG